MHDHHKLPHVIEMKRFRNKCRGALYFEIIVVHADVLRFPRNTNYP